MVAGLLGTTILLPSYLLVRDAPAFLAISVLNGLVAAHSLYGPASSALVADVVPPNRRGAVFGLMHASRNLGWTLGIALGALLLGFGFVPVFVAGGLLPLAFLFVVLLLVRDPPRHVALERPNPFRAWGALLSSGVFVAYLALTVVFFLGWGQVNTIFPLWLVQGLGLPERAVSVIAINSALIFLFQLPFGRLADRARRAMLLSLAALALGATYVAYLWTPLLAPAIPVLLLVGVGVVAFTVAEMLYSPILSAYAADLAPAGTTGSALGILAFATAVGQGAPPLLADFVVPRWGWSAVWGVLAALCVASAWGLAWFGRRVSATIDRPS
jgi:MFS family permease